MIFFFANIEAVRSDKIVKKIKEAESAMGKTDEKDVPFLALSLCVDCEGIWSNDDDLKRQNLVVVYDTSELVKIFSKIKDLSATLPSETNTWSKLD